MHFKNVLNMLNARDQYEGLEKDLQQLDYNAWRELKQKAIKYVAAKHRRRAYEQLFNTLSEVKGYLYLKSEGCTEVHFIHEENTPTPDLYGRCGSTGILMEVKAINPSDNELDWIRANSELRNGRMTARGVQTSLPASLKRKITGTINKAKKQLINYPHNEVQREIVYLVIKLDIGTSLNSRNLDELAEYIRRKDNEPFQVKYCFRGWKT